MSRKRRAEQLVELLQAQAAERPLRPAFSFLPRGEAEGSALTFADLDLRARSVARGLQERGVALGDRVLLCPAGPEDYVVGFLGCLYAGGVAVPACAPHGGQLRSRLAAIAADARPRVVLGDAEVAGRGPGMPAETLGGVPLLAAAELARHGGEEWRPPALRAESVALLQYTSGSTSQCKGAVIRHEHLLANQEMIASAFATNEESIVVSWLPLYHDMGLIGTMLHPLYLGAQAVMMPSECFLQKPLRWLQAVSRYGATVSGGPNFAYELCVQRIGPAERSQLDLSSWRVAFNGSEPVRASTLAEFSEAFGPSGFRSSAFLPCYGLAEASLFVTGGRREDSPPTMRVVRRELEGGRAAPAEDGDGHEVVNCGPSHGLDVRVVAPETRRECAPGGVGEIWVAGASVAAGYWNQPELSAETFAARCASGEGPFLRTGDLGFVSDGHLFVTGRLKDLLIVRGRNHHAEDLERTASRAHPALAGAICAVGGGEVGGVEAVLVVAEIRRREVGNIDEMAAAIRRHIAADHHLGVETVAFVRRGGIPRTSSGKIQRGKCRALLATGGLALLGRSDAAGATTPTGTAAVVPGRRLRGALEAVGEADRRVLVEDYLRRRLAGALSVPLSSVELRRRANDLGLDSLRAAELQAALEAEIDASLPPSTFLQERTLQEVADEIVRLLATRDDGRIEAHAGEEGADGDALRPSLDQERLWLVEKRGLPDASLNLTVAFRVGPQVERERLQEAIGLVARRQVALRAAFPERGGQPVGCLQPDLRVELPVADLAPASNGGADGLDRFLDAQNRTPFELSRGPLFRAALARSPEGELFLAATMHHIISDAWSFSVFAREVAEAYEGRSGGDDQARADQRRAAAYAAWQRSRVPGERLERQLAYWREILAPGLPALEWLAPEGEAAADPGSPLTFEVPSSTVAGLDAIARACGTTRFVVMLAAFTALLGRVSGADEAGLMVAVRGRTFPGADRVIGLFAHPAPLRASVPADLPFTSLVGQTAQAVRRASTAQDVPFARIAEFMGPARRGPSLLFTDLTLPAVPGHDQGLALVPCSFRFGSGGFGAAFAVHPDGDGMRAVVAWDPAAVDRERLQRLCGGYLDVMEACAATPQAALRELPAGKGEAADFLDGRQEWRLVVASTFVAEPLEAPWALWLEAMEVRHAIQFTPAGQLMQELLDPAGPLARNRNGANVLLVRVSDLGRRREGSDAGPEVAELVDAVRAAAERSAAPCVVCLCPPAETDEGGAETWRQVEREVARRLRELPAVFVIVWPELLATYPVEPYLDAFSDRLATVPYTPPFYAAVATMVLRRLFTGRRPPAKALIVDADETLWAGACGEDGPAGIALEPRHLALQHFLAAQQSAGVLLCLCSRNRAEDVEAAFAQHPDMPLRLSCFAASRVNHRPKSENVRFLAQELGLDLEACIFLDDDPVECADVRAHCPGVQVLRVTPEDDLPRLLPRLWAFERSAPTVEDRRRTSFYQTERSREQARLTAPSLQEFVDSLALQVDVRPLQGQDVERVAQLTFRTNQFNCTGVRRTEGDLHRLLADASPAGRAGLVVEARDRFGDYGLVGALALRHDGESLEVEWWVLSCRVLGRGVEHRILAHLGRTARQAAATRLSVHHRKTARNETARQFLRRFAEQVETAAEGASVFAYAPDRAAGCAFTAPRGSEEEPGQDSSSPAAEAVRRAGEGPVRVTERLDLQLLDPIDIARAAAERTAASRPRKPAGDAGPRTPTERRIAEIWASALGLGRVDVDENFYEAGGHSLAAIQILSRIREAFGVEVPVTTLFGREVTIAELAKAVEMAQIEQADHDALREQMELLSRLTDDQVARLLASEGEV